MMLIFVVEVGIGRLEERRTHLRVCYDIVHQYDKNELRPRECQLIPIPILKEPDICIRSADKRKSDNNRFKDIGSYRVPVMTFRLTSFWPKR